MIHDPIQFRAAEIVKCRNNPLFFILNYCYIPETGGSLKYSSNIMHLKLRRTVRALFKYNLCVLMASRQTGKSTIAACLISWALVFYPKIRAVIVNMKQSAGLHNLAMIRFIIEKLPAWMVTEDPFKSKSNIKTYLDLFNDSHVEVLYPSTIHDSSTIARSLSIPINF